MATKVTLRKRELPSGKITLYLDFYPPIRNPRTGELSRREYLGIYLEKNPRTSTAKTANAAKMRQAEAVRAQREISIINDSYDFIDRSRRKADFLAWFESVLKDKDQKWLRVYEHFKFFVHGNCKFEDVTIELCNGFKEYLTTADQLGHPGKKLAQNSAASYWSTFRALLAIAYKEKYLFENINDSLEKIPTIENRREFLTLDEVQALVNTPCKVPVLKQASLFSCLTGLRISDILALTWEDIQIHPDGGHCIVMRTEKTDALAYNPISQQAYDLLGKPGTGIVFKGLKRSMLQRTLPDWLSDAGITKNISFHCFRHTFATLLVSSGNPIYTVSKLLTHKNVATTQIYADLLDNSKREAAESIKLDINPKEK